MIINWTDRFIIVIPFITIRIFSLSSVARAIVRIVYRVRRYVLMEKQ